MKYFRSLLLFSALIISATGCTADKESFDDLIAQSMQKDIAKSLPLGSSVADSKSYFATQGINSRYVSDEHTLYAPKNIEPERKSLLPYFVIKSYDTRCYYTNADLLTNCTVAPSRKRWSQ